VGTSLTFSHLVSNAMVCRWLKKHLSLLESDCFRRVVRLQRDLNTHGDVTSPENRDQFIALVGSLEQLAVAMKLESASRAYRKSFTENYRHVLPDESRSYRVDILEAAIQYREAIWVNGRKFDFSDEVALRAAELQDCWSACLEEIQRVGSLSVVPLTVEWVLGCLLRDLDVAWANFERTYIKELMEIEAQARKILVHSIAEEQKLRAQEKAWQSEECKETLGRGTWSGQREGLVNCISQLNEVANSQGKGRGDLHVGILVAAQAVLDSNGRESTGFGERRGACSVALLLAAGVVESFNAMRLHLREVARCLERVDPQLCNNPALVEHLAAWERSWELGLRYLLKPELLTCLEDLAAEVLAAQRLLPELQGMCEDSDVEFFLILPRLLWLRFLSEPLKQKELIRSLLPQHFTLDDAHNDELEGLRERFCEVEKAHSGCRSALWEALVRRAVRGVCCKGLQAQPGSLAQAMDNLMRDLEGWSIKLQRQNPEDWNQCCHIIMQALL